MPRALFRQKCSPSRCSSQAPANDMTNQHYHFPSEAEREYACRAGTTPPFNWGDNWGELTPLRFINQSTLRSPALLQQMSKQTLQMLQQNGV